MNVRPFSATPTLAARLGWLAFTLLACAHFSVLYLWRCPQFLDLRLFAAGGERVPYQTRIFMAWILHETAGSARFGPVLARIATHLPKEFHDPYVLVLLVASFLAMLLAVFAARASLLHLTRDGRGATGDRRFASWAALLTIYMAYFNLIAVYGLTYALPYDVPALALFSIAVWLVLTQRYWLLLPVFAIGTLNRETFCFLTIFMALHAWFSVPATDRKGHSRSLRRAAPQIVLQAFIWLAIRMWLHHKYLANPLDGSDSNGVFDVHLVHNLKSLLNPPQWPLFLALFGFTLPLFVWGYCWIGNRALARSAAILLPLWAVAMMIVGVVVEVRIFDELTAFLVPCIGLIVWHRWVLPASQAALPQPN